MSPRRGMLLALVVALASTGAQAAEPMAAPQWERTIRSAADVEHKPSRVKWLLRKIVGIDPGKRTFSSPYGITVDGAGRVLVADSKAHTVHVLDLVAGKYSKLHTPSSNPMVTPVAVVSDGAGRMYVSDAQRSRIFVFNKDGKYQRAIGGLGPRESLFKRSTGIALDEARERLYVVDTVANQILVLSLDGKVLNRIGRRGAAAGEFNVPTQIALAKDGSLYVVDALNFRVQHLSPEGEPLDGFGRLGDAAGEFDKAKGIALDETGTIYVVEGRNDRVNVFSPEGALLCVFGETGSGNGQFFLPAGVAVKGNEIFVADSYNRRVQVFLRSTPGVKSSSEQSSSQ